MKTCSKCKNAYNATVEFFPPCNQRKDRLSSWCRECKRDANRKDKQRKRATPEGRMAERLAIQKWMRSPKGRKITRARSLAYAINRRKNDPMYRMIQNIQSLIRIGIKKQGFSKNSRTSEILGCTFDEFRHYIEQQFIEGMSWENHGSWHFDHIIPISSATNEAEILKLNHFSNFQPLWAADNIRKSNHQ